MVSVVAHGAATYSLTRDFSVASNPNGVWSYGYTPNLGGPFTLMATPRTDEVPSIPIWSWSVNGFSSPDVHYNASSNHVFSADGGTFPPKSLWVAPGHETSSNAFAVMRFTAPSNGLYRVQATAQSYIDEFSHDSEFHVVTNRIEVIGAFLAPGAQRISTSNQFRLLTGDMVDFVVGRGRDGQLYASSLKLEADITVFQTNVPPPPPPSTNSVPVPSGLVAWWPFEGNGADLSGLGHTMELFGAPVFGNGEVRQALILDGANDYGRVATSTDLDLGANAGLTMEMWINPSSTAVQQPLLEWTDNNSVVGLHFWISVASAGGGNGSLFANVIDRNGMAHHVSSPPGVVAANTFTHVAMSYAKSNGLAKLYANGQLVASSNIGNITPETRNALYIGWRPIGGEWRFTGKLDEISLYNRELSLGEIAAIAQAGPAGKSGGNTNSPPPPPPASGNFDLSRDFAMSSNPSDVWSYGWKSNFTGPLGLLSAVRTFGADNGVPIRAWELSTYQLPVVAKVLGTNTAVSDSGRFTAPGGTVYFAPGADGTPQNYGIIRFTAPTGGNYRVELAVVPLFDGTRSRDSDFHVLRNGAEIFGAFLAPNTGTNFAGIISLADGGVLDFAIGRGADSLTADTGLKITAVIAPTTNGPTVTNPPPVVTQIFDIARDFRTNSNPNGVWSYGWQNTVGGAFTTFTHTRTGYADNGVPYSIWELNTAAPPLIEFFPFTNALTGTSDGGQGQYPPGAVVYYAGNDGSAQNLATIRFTAPSNANYRIGVAVQSYLDGPTSGDTDFHVAKNTNELFGQFLPSRAGTNYTNIVALAAGDTIDFSVGRGADGVLYGSGLRIGATIIPTPNGPTVTNPPPAVVPSLISLWHADGNAEDAVGTNDGVLVNNVGFAPGVSGQAFRFDGTNFVRVADSASLDLTNELTMQMWFKRDENLPLNATFTLMDKRTIALANFGANMSQNYGLQLYYNTGSGFALSASSLPSGGAWHHFAGTYRQRSNGVQLVTYIDGTATRTNTLPGTLAAAINDAPLVFGTARDGAADYFRGLIDEVALYNYALSASQIQSNYNNVVPPGTNLPPVTPALISLWHADGDAVDAVGTNDGVLVNNVGFAPGVSGQAFRFDGTNFVRVTDSASLDLANELTMQMWFKRDENLPLNATFTLMDKRTIALANFGANMSQNYGLQLYYNTGSGFALSASSLPSGGVWHHFAGTYRQRSNGVELTTYIDGGAVRTNTLPGTLAAAINNAPLVIGTARDGAADYFKGLIDEVALYNYALSASQVLSNYNNATPPGTNMPPAIAANFDVVRDFSLGSNPNGVWSYGWQSNTAGLFTPVTYARTTTESPGVTLQIWEFNTGTPSYFLHFPSSNTGTGTSDSGYGQYPPGTLIAQAGAGTPQNLATIRFTAPSNGNYRVNVTARSYLDGGPAGDTDFHVTHNGTELFGQFLPSVGSVGYTNLLSLAAGDTIDFASGRGADNNFYGSGLKIAAVITPTSQPSGTNTNSSGFSITSPKVAGNGFQFMLAPGAGSSGVIEASDDLVHWSVLTNIVCTNSLMPFHDVDALKLPHRFYRVRPGAP